MYTLFESPIKLTKRGSEKFVRRMNTVAVKRSSGGSLAWSIGCACVVVIAALVSQDRSDGSSLI